MVRRSLEAANAIIAGNSPSLMTSAIMGLVSRAARVSVGADVANVTWGSLLFG